MATRRNQNPEDRGGWAIFREALQSACTRHHEDFSDVVRSTGVGRALKEGFSYSALEKLTHVNHERLKAVIEGAGKCSANELELIAKAFGMSDDELAALIVLRESAEESALFASAAPARVHDESVLFEFNRWSTRRPLTPENHSVVLADRGETACPDGLGAAIEELTSDRELHGSVATVVAIGGIDWREANGQHRYTITVRRSDYVQALAMRRIVTSDPSIRSQVVAAAIDGDSRALTDLNPFVKISANVNVVTADAKVVIARRSAQVQDYRNQWNLGVNETMADPDGSAPENFFELTERALSEELGIEPAEVENIVINWFGFCLDCSDFVLFAHVLTSLNSDQVSARWFRDAPHGVEHSQLDFLEASEATLRSVVAGDPPRGDAPEGWLHHAGLSGALLIACLDQVRAPTA